MLFVFGVLFQSLLKSNALPEYGKPKCAAVFFVDRSQCLHETGYCKRRFTYLPQVQGNGDLPEMRDQGSCTDAGRFGRHCIEALHRGGRSRTNQEGSIRRWLVPSKQFPSKRRLGRGSGAKRSWGGSPRASDRPGLSGRLMLRPSPFVGGEGYVLRISSTVLGAVRFHEMCYLYLVFTARLDTKICPVTP